MSRLVQYTVVSIDLSTAGKECIDGPWGVLRFLDAVNAAGDVATDALLSIRSERSGELVPFRLGFGFFAESTRRWIVSWEAQTGITVKLGLADNPRSIDWDADPPAKLLTGSVKIKGGSTLSTVADVSIAATTTAAVIAANSTRRYVDVTNLAANVTAFRVGDAGAAAAEGREIMPGETVRLDTTAAVSAYNPHSAAQSLSLLEVAD